ncbi:MAG: DUF4112 domain-containing protein [Gemmatimonadales bacterium]
MTNPVAPRTPSPLVGTYPPPQLERLRALSRLLDNAFVIPGTQYRFGLDPLIGLVPGLGDAVSAVFSAYIVLQASRLGAPRSVVTRMIANVALDTVVGWIPVLGDLFDAAWKSNLKNVALLEHHLQQPGAARAGSRKALLLLSGVLLLFFVGAVALGVVVAKLVLNLLQ